MVKVTKLVKTTVEIPLTDLRRALRLPSWGRLTISGLKSRTTFDGNWSDVAEALPMYKDEAKDSTVIFTTEQHKTKHKSLR